jgi:hypothetical protein
MNRIRGAVMFVAAAVAFWEAGRMRGNGRSALWACGLGVLALGLAAWHLMRKPPQPRE